MGKNITVRVSDDEYERYTEFADRFFGGNRSMLVKNALEAYILNSGFESDNEMREEMDLIKGDIEEIKKELNELRITIKQLFKMFGGREEEA